MKRLLTVALVALLYWPTYRATAQDKNVQYKKGTVGMDKKGRLTTTFNTYRSTITYLGSAYLGDTVWHSGSLIYQNQHEMFGQIAYNIAKDEVYWRLNDTSAISQAMPDAFTFEGRQFIGNQYKYVGVNRVDYYEVLYDGPTKLVRKWTKQVQFIDRKSYSVRTGFDDQFNGKYVLSQDLFIQKEGERPKFVTRDEYSLSRALPHMGTNVSSFIASHPLTDSILVEALAQYDNYQSLLKQRQ